MKKMHPRFWIAFCLKKLLYKVVEMFTELKQLAEALYL